ncbi:MAG TPA: nuclear transport factor 2 family protein [Candidatus Limnocylindrales bacterium]|jgi:ketosteroid isomerase-like protein
MDHAAFQSWLDRYIDAWHSNDAATVGDLFTEDALYRYHPWDEPPVRGREAIVGSWLGPDRDAPDSWKAEYRALAVDGDLGVAVGESRYLTEDRSAVERTYHNVFVCRFADDGRCREFTEYYMLEKAPDDPAP